MSKNNVSLPQNKDAINATRSVKLVRRPTSIARNLSSSADIPLFLPDIDKDVSYNESNASSEDFNPRRSQSNSPSVDSVLEASPSRNARRPKHQEGDRSDKKANKVEDVDQPRVRTAKKHEKEKENQIKDDILTAAPPNLAITSTASAASRSFSHSRRLPPSPPSLFFAVPSDDLRHYDSNHRPKPKPRARVDGNYTKRQIAEDVQAHKLMTPDSIVKSTTATKTYGRRARDMDDERSGGLEIEHLDKKRRQSLPLIRQWDGALRSGGGQGARGPLQTRKKRRMTFSLYETMSANALNVQSAAGFGLSQEEEVEKNKNGNGKGGEEQSETEENHISAQELDEDGGEGEPVDENESWYSSTESDFGED
ncbi:hypothetical protein GGU10DRAFT_375807 [Lentinula aff. detonsa]|uniref:Uncharacterized protein n=1 Tax=Lentinula aff. detonsa TaxID=2804958 RepID=A0AA38KZE2_9AGAR|nr:hypothetical protein GGU10DRAFT_375807 [Lentinula aff. detonsa]